MRTANLMFALLLCGCVENEEKVVVHADGSVDVTMSAKGGTNDLVDGYAVPLQAPWRALDETTLDWIDRIGPDTGSAASQAQLREHGFNAKGGEEVTLAATAHFGSVSDLPRFIASESELYRTSHLERETTLTVEHKGARTIYTFERTFGARRWRDWQVLGQLEERLPEDARTAISKSEPLSNEQWPEVTRIVRELYRASTSAFARDALSSVYTAGDASLPTPSFVAALVAVDREIAELVTEPRLREIYAAMIDPQRAGDLDPSLNPDLLARDALRSALERSLAQANVARETCYAVLERLEADFTAFDQTIDLGDESFGVEVEMPGVVVLGNYNELDGSTARWDFKGDDLHDAARVLRVVSVVE